MLSVDDARAVMLAEISPLAAETVSLEQALGRTLAAPLTATRAQPPFDASAMDGYAIRAADAPGVLRCVGESAAGHAYAATLQAGECVRISTGAPLPRGADAILIQEDAQIEGDSIRAPALRSGQHVRRRGGDFAANERLLDAGHRLDAGAVALAATAGHATFQVVRAPKLTVIATGDEIVSPGATPRDDQIFESGSFGAAALARQWGAEAQRGLRILDSLDQTRDVVASALEASDLVVIIGGASVGPHDHARPAVEALGLTMHVSKVKVKPGKPTWFATSSRGRVLGLPGNPASALVCARLFLQPLIARFCGRSSDVTFRHAQLAAPLRANGDRESYLRAVVDESAAPPTIQALGDQDSSLTTILARSNALIRHAVSAPAADRGAWVSYLSWQ